MTRCKLKIIYTLLGLLMLTITSVFNPQQALAFTLQVSNDNPKTLSVAVLCYDDNLSSWVTRGWYNVPSGEEKSFKFGNSNQFDYVYLYAMSGNREWYPENYDDGDQFIARTVINKSFKYSDSEECPDGPKRRNVAFSKSNIINGVVNISWQ